MNDNIEQVKKYYDENALREWERFDRHPFEFIFTTYMMEKYITPGDSILDIGGGPGRYSIYFAKQSCKVTLVDLSGENVALARKKSEESDVLITLFVKNCLELDDLQLGEFDHVFLMGPLYHLKDKKSQTEAVNIALRHLKPGGKLYVSFILAFAGILFDLKNRGLIERDATNPTTKPLLDAIVNGRNYDGPAFTTSCFYHPNRILPFVEQFPLKKLHLFGQEGILAPNEPDILTREKEEIDCWIDIAKRFLELPELLFYSEHAMYIGEKTQDKQEIDA